MREAGRSQAFARTVANAVSHSVKCSMVAAADLNKHLDCDDRLFILHVNAIDDGIKVDYGALLCLNHRIQQST